MSRLTPAVAVLALASALSFNHAKAGPRAFVASTGSDANTSMNCAPTTPCRSFAAALAVVDAGGEIVALDAAGYGMVTITKSVSLVGNPGAHAGIAASSGVAVNIATASVNVVLRNLTINGIGGATGVSMSDGASLTIENCLISNFTNDGVAVLTPAAVRVVNTTVRGNGGAGLFFYGGATATVVNTQAMGNYWGVFAETVAAVTTTVSVSDSVAAGNTSGFYATASMGTARMSVTRSTMSNNYNGLAIAAGNTGNALATVSNSMATGNAGYGLANSGGGASAILESLGNNTVRQNSLGDTVGTITMVSGS